MASSSSNPTPPSDIWAEWLLHRRHGGDPKQEPVIRDFARRIGEQVLDGAQLVAGNTLVDVGTGEAFGSQLNEVERKQVEEWLRPQVESGAYTERSAVAYLTAVKGHPQMAQMDAENGDLF